MPTPRANVLACWIGAGALLALAVSGCRPRSYPLDGGGGGGDGQDASVGCSCDAPGGNGAQLKCGASTCSDGTLYLCTGEALIATGDCGGGDGGAGPQEGGPGTGCTPICSGRTCHNPDGCGGVCQCAAGLPCDAVTGSCGNGCELQANDPCQPDASALTDPQSCCADGYRCTTDDAGASGCCVTTSVGDAGLGTCQSDQDCCAYPAVHCQLSHLCE